MYEDTIKVRFGADVPLQIRYTANGVVLPPDLLDGEAGSLVVWLPREVLPSEEEQEKGKVYALGYSYSPVMQKKLGVH